MDNYMYNLCCMAIFVIFCIAEEYIKYLDNKNRRL